MSLSTILPTLLAGLQRDTLALAQTMIRLSLAFDDQAPHDCALPNVLASTWVLRIVLISECLAEISASVAQEGPAAARSVATRHRRMLDQARLSRGLPALRELRPIARQQLQIERRYGWLCRSLADKTATIAA